MGERKDLKSRVSWAKVRGAPQISYHGNGEEPDTRGKRRNDEVRRRIGSPELTVLKRIGEAASNKLTSDPSKAQRGRVVPQLYIKVCQPWSGNADRGDARPSTPRRSGVSWCKPGVSIHTETEHNHISRENSTRLSDEISTKVYGSGSS